MYSSPFHPCREDRAGPPVCDRLPGTRASG